jgi:hypothetical protein
VKNLLEYSENILILEVESSKLISRLIIRQPCAEAAVLHEFGNVP